MRAEPAASQDPGHRDLFLAPFIGLHAVRLIALAHRAGAQGLIHLALVPRWAEQLARAVKGLSPDLEVRERNGYQRASSAGSGGPCSAALGLSSL